MIVAAISIVAFVVNIALGVRACRRMRTTPHPVRRGDIAWMVALAILQLCIGIMGAAGLAQDEPVAPLIMNAVVVAVAQLCLTRSGRRERLVALAGRGGRFPHPKVANVAALIIAGVATTLALEIPSNHNLLWMYPLCLLLELALITGLMVGTFYLFQRRGVAPALVAFLFFAVGIAEYFVILFKSLPIQPGDLTAITTAAAVGGGYVFRLDSYCLYGAAFLALALLICAHLSLARPAREGRTRKLFVRNLAIGAVCLAATIGHVTLIDYYNTLNIQVYTWRPLESYYRMGFIPSFVSSAQTIKPRMPEGYTKDGAEMLINGYATTYDESAGSSDTRAEATAQFAEEQPAVVVIMNETFSDLSEYQNLRAGYEGPQFFQSIDDALERGRFYVSAYGGGTCNTEFEVLTGNSMAFVGNGVYPYTIYNLTHAENLAQQFSELGYTTTAMHPNHATNWNRENVYRDFGFDQFLSIEDFAGAETLRDMVTDAATYDKIIEMLEADESPQFIFDVTMQNHSGYDTGLIPLDKRVSYLVDGQYDPEVDEYLALIEESDRALEEFLANLEDLDRPVVVLFFGDHQPFFPSDFNDAWFTDEDEATHSERLYHTDYAIWANYDVAGNDQVSQNADISANFIGARLLELIGAPLSSYQKAQLALRSSMPALNSIGYEDMTGTWHLSSAAEDDAESLPETLVAATKARDDLAKMQYLKLFDHGDSVYTKTFQSAANETDPNLAPGTTKIK